MVCVEMGASMGRIDDALRRSGVSERPSSPVPSGSDVFVSPWSVSAAPEPRPVETVSGARAGVPADSGSVSAVELVADRVDLLTGSSTADPALSSQFRRMAARLYNAHEDEKADLKLVMVTSAVPAEGKTTTAVNLALILSESFQEQVLLIDADLRRPSLHNVWGLAGDRGLSDALRPVPEPDLELVRVSKTLTLLPAGNPDADPTAGLTSERMRQILAQARTQFDWVILDTPPIGAVDDATLLGAMVDAVLFVVRACQTRSPLVLNAIDLIGRDKIIGVVLNGTEAVDTPSYHYPGYGYSSGA